MITRWKPVNAHPKTILEQDYASVSWTSLPKPIQNEFLSIKFNPSLQKEKWREHNFKQTLIELKFPRQLTNSRMFNNKISSIFCLPLCPFSRNINGPVWISIAITFPPLYLSQYFKYSRPRQLRQSNLKSSNTTTKNIQIFLNKLLWLPWWLLFIRVLLF
jgi:hypothetical protein